MKRLYDFQKFDRTFFENVELLVVSEKNKEDRQTLSLIILEDNNIYKNGEVGINRFEKIFVNITNPNFEEIKFNEGDPFDMKRMEDDIDVSIFGEKWARQLSVRGKYIE